jgi:hypothetical protein
MGLDIVAYSKVQKIVVPVGEDEDEYYGFVKVGGIPWDRCDDLEDGWYEETNESIGHGFRAGAYSGYNQFRRDLSLGVNGVTAQEIWDNEEKYSSLPLYEIINFGDNEGCFGPSVSRKLHTDFVNNRGKFELHMLGLCEGVSESMHFKRIMEIYDDFTLAFEIASDSGILNFR